MPAKKSFSQLKLELEIKFPHLILLFCEFKNTKSLLKILDTECNKIFYRSFNRIMQSNYPGHPDNQQNRIEATFLKKYGVKNPLQCEKVKEKHKKTCLSKYGVSNVAQVKEIQDKVAKSMNNSYIKYHWKSKVEIHCVGKYESCVIDYLNNNLIDYIWKPITFVCNNNKRYFPDLYLVERDIYVEIKGRFFQDAKNKWEEFKLAHPNSELWSKKELKNLGITDKVLDYKRSKKGLIYV